MAVARAHAAATADADTAAAGCAHVVIGETDGLRRIDRGRLLHLLRRRVGHRHFGHVEILHLVAATTAAARFEVHHDQLAPALLVDGDDQNEQQRDVKRDRERERTDHESYRAADRRPESARFLASLVGIDRLDFQHRRGRCRGCADRTGSRECGELALTDGASGEVSIPLRALIRRERILRKRGEQIRVGTARARGVEAGREPRANHRVKAFILMSSFVGHHFPSASMRPRSNGQSPVAYSKHWSI